MRKEINMEKGSFKELGVKRHIELLGSMFLIRFFEEAAGQFYRKGMVKGGIHASIGQEAVAVGVCANLSKKDYITSTHRGHGHHIAKGANVNKLMAEILGKESGYCKGRGGSMHVAAFDVGSLGAFPIVAAGVPSAVGAALSTTLRGEDNLVVAFFGDGALGQGTIYECMNMAAIWGLPLIFVCENNQYAVSTNCSTSLAITNIAEMAASHGLDSIKVDGQHLEQVYDGMANALDIVKNKKKPVFIQAETYRFEGHYFGEPEVNRDKEEVKRIRASRDPINLFITWLENKYGEPIKDEINDCEMQTKRMIDDACEFAQMEKEPEPDTFEEYIYA